MRVLLVYPPLTLHKLDVSIPAKSTLIGLGYIASVLRQQGHEVKILDCLVASCEKYPIDGTFVRAGLSDDRILDAIERFRPDVIGVSSMFTSYFKNAHHIARIAKDYKKDVLVVFGGAHASSFPEIVMKDPNVDVVVIGEGENTIRELLQRYGQKKGFTGVNGIMHRSGQVLKREAPREFIRNLDEIPFPAWDLLERDLSKIEQENRSNRFLMRKPIGYLLTSRGCPNACYFCSVKLIWSRSWRARSAKNIVDEIEFLKGKYGFREFHFVDDNSSVSKKRMHEICDELLRRNLNVKIATPTGIAIGTLDREILTKMKKAGFYRLCFGIESGDPETQKIIKKRINLDQAKQVIREANRLGFWTSGTFIMGFPHEDLDAIRKTVEFAKISDMDYAVIYLLTPQPGTEVYRIFKEQGLIDLDRYLDPRSQEWYRISITYCNGFKNLQFSNTQLQEMLSEAYREFILHKLFSVRTYINLLRKIRSFEDLRYMMNLMVMPLRMLKGILLGKRLSNLSVRGKIEKQLEPIMDTIEPDRKVFSTHP